MIGAYKNTIYLSIAIMGSLFFSQCKPEEFNDPIEPVISLEKITLLKDSTGKDSLISVTLEFSDGDGDFGLNNDDTMSPFRFGEPYLNNMWITLEYKDANNNWITASNDSLGLDQRVPRLTPEGKYKSIRGSITLFINPKPTPTFSHELVRYSFVMVDRGLHESTRVPGKKKG